MAQLCSGGKTKSGLVGEERFIDARDDLYCIFIIHLLQDVIAQAQAIHGPEGMVFFMIRKKHML